MLLNTVLAPPFLRSLPKIFGKFVHPCIITVSLGYDNVSQTVRRRTAHELVAGKSMYMRSQIVHVDLKRNATRAEAQLVLTPLTKLQS